MVLTGNSSDCYNFINHTSELIIDLSPSSSSAFVGAASSLTAIVLLVVHLSTDIVHGGLIGYLTSIAHIFEVDSNVQFQISMPAHYLIMLCVFVPVVLYLFSLAVFRVQLNAFGILVGVSLEDKER